VFCVFLRLTGITCDLYTVYHIKLSNIKWEVCNLQNVESIRCEKIAISETWRKMHPIRSHLHDIKFASPHGAVPGEKL